MVMMSTLHPLEVWYSIEFCSEDEVNIMVLFNIGLQKNAEELLDEGSIAYFQEDEDYYGRGPMLNDDFICQTTFRDEEFGHCDRDFRMTPRGRAYLRMKSLRLRTQNPKEATDPLPSHVVNSERIVLKLIDLTVDDGDFFYGVCTEKLN